ncbi:MAG: VanZ family protein [Flavobacteriaceae bacterium]|nr:VanZ family protein [Flavobacteriaceae bacterium]
MIKLIKKLLGPRPLFYLGLLYTTVVTVLFMLPAGDIPKVAIRFGDKWAHICVFILLTGIWLMIAELNHWFSKNKIVWSSAAILLYGIIIEVLQEKFFETRSADIWDVVADLIGILLAVFVFVKMKKRISLKT